MEVKTVLEGKVHPRTGYEGPGARWGGGWSKLGPGRFNTRNNLVSIVQEAGLSSRPGWNNAENIASQRDSNSRPSSP